MHVSILRHIAKTCQVGLAAVVISMLSMAEVRASERGILLSQQIVPDDTLGTESSIVTDSVINGDTTRRIEGGATRGSNLFHSFSDFNVNLGESVYFANPVSIDNIISRVTGNSLSTINGILGVNGTANLFFLNPNGIIFGPEGQLDIRGSFTASTAERFSFADGETFSAVVPDTSLLTVSVPLGIQFNNPPQGDLANAAFLAVGQGADLNLIGNQVSTTVQLAAPGGTAQVFGNQIELVDRETPISSNPMDVTEIIFRALDTITIPDVADNELRFLDGLGDIHLIADADTDSVGNLVMVDQQDSLRASGRNVNSSGVNIILGEIDTSTFGDGRNGGNIAISSVSGDISTQTLNSSSRSYSVSYAPSTSTNSGNGGDISISSAAGNIRTQTLNSGSESVSASASASTAGDSGDGGNISISSISGDISTQALNSGSRSYAYSLSIASSGNSGDGGDISISSMSGDISTQTVDSGSRSYAYSRSYSSYSRSEASSGDSGNGGSITISAMSGDIDTQSLNSFSLSQALSRAPVRSTTSITSSGDSGDGGDISISSTSGDITIQDVDSGSRSLSRSRSYTGLVESPGNSGNGGDISISSTSGSITAQNLDSGSSSRSSVVTAAGDSGNGGNISISSTSGDIATLNLNSTAGSRSLFTRESGDGGNITISSTSGNITTQYLNASSIVPSGGVTSPGNSGDGGDISISSISGDISTQGLDSYSYSRSFSNASYGDSGNGGAITITSESGSISTQSLDSSSDSSYGDSGNGGAITISSTSGSITTQASVLSSTSSRGDSGNGGAITISSTSGNITTQALNSASSASPALNPGSNSSSEESGNGGAIRITSESGNITTNEEISSNSSSNSGIANNGGDIEIIAGSGDITINNNLFSFSFSSSGAAGDGGDILLQAENGAIRGADNQITSFSVVQDGGETGTAGRVALEANTVSNLEVITLSNAGISGDILIHGTGDDTTIENLSLTTTAQVVIPDPANPGTTLTLNLNNVGQSGNTLVTSEGNLIFDAVTIQSDANGDNPAGNTKIISPGQITFNNSQINSNANSSGAAGNIRIQAAQLSLGEGDLLSAATSGTGRGGSITINTSESVSLGENVQDSATIISVEASGAGRPGNIIINTPSFELAETARITATATATANNPDGTGSISLNANQMNLAGTVGIFAETQGQAPGGTLTLQPYQANLNNPNRTQPHSPQIASDAALNSGASFSLTLTEGAVISASTSGRGNGGGLQLLAPEAITISGPGRLAVETSGPGQAGNITATARTFTLTDGANLSASTSGEGQAGNITFNIADELSIDGNGTIVESLTTPGSQGRGGNINVFNTGVTNLTNGGTFSLNSAGQGAGGNLDLTARSLTLDDSNITATTLDSNGGNFTFNLSDYLLLRNGSLISTEAGTARAGGNGGSITINIPDGFIIAVPEENSDIRANAFDGNGGNVTITTRNLFGIAFRPGLSDTPRSDITSSSQFGNSGTVTVNELNAETLQPETELPAETEPATVARGCRGQGSQTGRFVSTGRGGLPTSPVDPLSDDTIWQDLDPLDTSSTQSSPADARAARPELPPDASTDIPIVEAQGWARTSDGRISLFVEQPDSSSVHLTQAGGC